MTRSKATLLVLSAIAIAGAIWFGAAAPFPSCCGG